MHSLSDDFLRHVLSTSNTPLYVYELDRTRARINEIRQAFGGVQRFSLLFATMANPSTEMLSFVAGSGLGACVNSIAHLNKSISVEVPPSKIHFTSTGVSNHDMREIAHCGANFNADSSSQLLRWIEESGGRPCGLRVNASTLCNKSTQKSADRIGIAAERIPELAIKGQMLGGRVIGLHVYLGTNFSSPTEMLPSLETLFLLARDIEDIEYVNIGGGMGLDYSKSGIKFDLEYFGLRVTTMLRDLELNIGREVELVFEPGRGLVGDSAVFIASVTDCKSIASDYYVAVDASVAIFPRPLHHPDSPHKIKCLNGSLDNAYAGVKASIVGRTTFSKDILGSCMLPECISLGDVLVFEDAGAYCDSMRSSFLGQTRANNLYFNSGEPFVCDKVTSE